jgi:hypothetical protein
MLRPGRVLRLTLTAIVGLSTPALAHTLRVSTGEFRVEGKEVTGALQFARAELDAIRHEELAPSIQVQAEGRPCRLTQASAHRAQEDGLELDARWLCAEAPGHLRISLGFLDLLPAGHVHVALLKLPGGTVQRTARAGAPVLEVEAHPGAWAGGVRFLRLGMEHIFGGLDHIAFLIGVLLLGGTLAQLLGIVTAFTLAHSVTLAVATVGWFVPPSRLIEPLIAASIVAVALENLWALRAPVERIRVTASIARRWRITFAFGLVHGFGLAGALRALELPRELLAPSLLTFNLGVEVGQLGIVALAWPLLRWFRSLRGVWPRGLRWASAVLAGVGGVWIIQRVISPV